MINGGIYIHVPFCLSKCYYCNFYSVPVNDILIEDYYNSLVKEINTAANKYPLAAQTLYLGGGTPSILSTHILNKIIKLVTEKFNLAKKAEITLEVNPDTVTLQKAKQWQKIGINRVSMGFQSTNNKILQAIGRRHNKNQAITALNYLELAGINNINIDLMYGLPYQTINDWQSTLNCCSKFNITHLSAYPLQVEENTKLADKIDNNELKVADEDTIVEMMFMAKHYLEQQGFKHYEIANYALPGYQSKHNLGYWHYEPYLGFGPAAASFYDNIRWSNSASLKQYTKQIGDSCVNIDLDSNKREVQMAEYCFLSLRLLKDGLNKDQFKDKFNTNIEDVYGEKLLELVNKQLLLNTGNKYCLSTKAIPLANQVFIEFLPDCE